MIDGKLMILGRPCSAGGAGRWLRTEQHLDYLIRQDLAHCPVIQPDDDHEMAWKAKCLADVFVSAGTPVLDAADTILRWTEPEKGVAPKPWVWDLDDNPTTLSPHNPAYRVFGLEEVKLDPPVNGVEWLWKDGWGGFDLEGNHARFETFIKLLNSMSAITTTTQYLADKIRKFAPSVPIYLRPNLMDFEEMWTRKAKPSRDGKVRIIYQGGSSHREDLDSVLPALKKIADRYPHVVFLFNGDTKAHAEKMIPANRIEEVLWTGDYATFALRMAALGPDIAIAPLCMTLTGNGAEFNRCKSSLKWLDAAAVGIPCVCQWDTPYQEVVNFGQASDSEWNGILAATPDDWETSLRQLIENRDMRETIGANAYNEAFTNWNAATHAKKHLREYEEIVNGDHHVKN